MRLVEWLEWLSNGVEEGEFGSWLGSANDWKTLSVVAAVNGYLFINQGRIRQRKERLGSAFHMVYTRYRWPLTSTAIR